MTSVLIVPGYTNSGPEHWQSLWERRHPHYQRVEQEDWDYPDVNEWVNTLNDHILQSATSPVVLVAHSLGCLTTAHWALRHNGPVVGALLVAPPDIEQPGTSSVFQSFAPIPLTRLPFPSIVVASTNDPYIKLQRAQELSDAWGARFVNLGACGHINTDAGFGSWDEGEALLTELLNISR